MKAMLYVKDIHDQWAHVSTATTEQELDSMMKYATYKVSYGSDVKIEHVKK